MSEIPDPLPLRSIPVPPEVTAVTGCDCGGMEWHRNDCSIRSLSTADATAAVDAARDRLQDYTAKLNAKLHDTLGTTTNRQEWRP